MNDALRDTATLADPFDSAQRGGRLVLFGLEFTAWEGSQDRNWSESWEAREIIQIGAVKLLDDASFTEADRFLCHVMPETNPTLSDYITRLTDIDQATVDAEGFEFTEAFELFLSFCDDARAVLSYGGDPEVLAENCRLREVEPPDWSRFQPINPILARRAGPEFAKSSSFLLPALVGLEPERREHDAMDDTLQIARTLRILRERGLL